MIETIYKKEENKVPIKSWVTGLEEAALNQAKNLSNLPFVFKHVALMPDSHQGFGMPIGGVIAVKGAVIPNAVGVDIGCGMCVVKTHFKIAEINTELLKQIMGKIREVIPLGFDHHKEAQDEKLMPNLEHTEIVEREYKSALTQLGTLGGGNHFIEIQKGDDGFVWIMLHSGSRNIGNRVATYYNKLALELNRKWASGIPDSWELNFLPINSDEGKDYMKDMQYCLEFAFANRKLMMDNIKKVFVQTLKENQFEFLTNPDKYFDPMINIHHNYAAFENHFGENVIIHRKGATKSLPGLIGIIPGSQGTCSYIVEGLGNPESFMSCSHGAGRKMGRKDACRRLNLEEEKKKLDDLGIVHGIRNVNDLDEASGAYKSIDEVMNNQADLVKIITKLSPLGVIKG